MKNKYYHSQVQWVLYLQKFEIIFLIAFSLLHNHPKLPKLLIESTVFLQFLQKGRHWRS